jgi:hypothetical protein
MRSAKDTASAAIHRHERQLESLIDRLPNELQATTRSYIDPRPAGRGFQPVCC